MLDKEDRIGLGKKKGKKEKKETKGHGGHGFGWGSDSKTR